MDEIQSLGRGLKILLLMAEAADGIGVTDLAAHLGVNKGTASRMVHTLQKYGFVEKAKDGRRYRLGPALVQLSRAVIDRSQTREIARPYLKQLVVNTGECAHLAIYAQGRALYIDQVESEATLRVNTGIGHLAPLHCTALGKALLAFGRYPLPKNLEKRTPQTLDSPEKLETELANVRSQGFAVDNEEYDIGVRCIAVPIFDYAGGVAGAIGVSGPAARIKTELIGDIARQVVDIGQALTAELKFLR